MTTAKIRTKLAEIPEKQADLDALYKSGVVTDKTYSAITSTWKREGNALKRALKEARKGESK